MKIRTILAIWAAKAARLACKLKGTHGETFPGRVALKIDPAIIRHLIGGIHKHTFVVCGTNGKTTTNNLLCAALEREGHTVVCNHTGSNMLPGVATALVLAANWVGKFDAEYACLEVDEASARRVLKFFQPDTMVLTNLFRDQLDRYGELDITMDLLHQGIELAPDMTLVVNADDALAASLAVNSGHPYVTYGAEEQVFDKPDNHEIREGTFCKQCGTRLHYDFYHYSQLGSYRCPKCGFTRPKIDFNGSQVEMKNGLSFAINGQAVTSSFRGFYNIYNILAVYAAAASADIPLPHFQEVLTSFQTENGRNERFVIDGCPVFLSLAKNPTGFNQNLSVVFEDDTEKDLIIAINDNAQDGADVSWLWDVDFDRLAAKQIRSITASGIRAQDMRLRLKYTDIPSMLEENIKTAIEKRLQDGCGNLYVLVNYTALDPTRRALMQMAEQKEGEA